MVCQAVLLGVHGMRFIRFSTGHTTCTKHTERMPGGCVHSEQALPS